MAGAAAAILVSAAAAFFASGPPPLWTTATTATTTPPLADPQSPPAAVEQPPPAAPASAGSVAPPPPPPRTDHRRLADIVASWVTCGVVGAAADDGGVSVTGLARSDEAAKVRHGVERLRLPAGAARIEIAGFDGPFCDVLAAVRAEALAPSPPLRAALASPAPLAGGQPLRFRVSTPDWPSRLHVTYLSLTGDAIHLAAAPTVLGPRASVAFGDDGRWTADAPYGTDLLLVVASDAPLSARPRPSIERITGFASALAAALRALRDTPGRRVAVHVIPVQTVAAR